MTIFDKENFYNETIEAKVLELKQLCAKEKIPMFVCLCVKNDESGTVYKKDMVSPVPNGIELKENYIPKLVDVTLGFDTVPPRQDFEIDF